MTLPLFDPDPPPAPTPAGPTPNPALVRGRCPECGDLLVSEIPFVPGHGYLTIHACRSARGENATCDYQRVT